MRTKTLLVAAALSAAGFATSLAQSNVYSLNVVGYINIPTPTNGLYLVAPAQLDFDGTGVNNTVLTTFGTGQGGVPYAASTHIYAFDKTAGSYVQAIFAGGAWVAGQGLTDVTAKGLQSGQGVFYERRTGSPTNLTFVGNVLQGALVNTPSTGTSLTSSKVPQAGGVSSVLGLSLPTQAAPQNIYQYNGSYANRLFLNGNWVGSEPSINVGEAFFLNAAAGATWTRNFTVQ
jgi:hypothetical protein